jgi:hypothetical protein
MTIVNEARTQAVTAPVPVPDDVFAAAYAEAMVAAERFVKRRRGADDYVFTDAATTAVLWARDHCVDAARFPQFCKRTVRTFLCRASAKRRVKIEARPQQVALCEEIAAGRAQAPTGPILIDGLPSDLAFVARLFTIDGYTVREIALLCGIGQQHRGPDATPGRGVAGERAHQAGAKEGREVPKLGAGSAGRVPRVIGPNET